MNQTQAQLRDLCTQWQVFGQGEIIKPLMLLVEAHCLVVSCRELLLLNVGKPDRFLAQMRACKTPLSDIL